MLPRSEAPPTTALALMATFAARGRYGELWDVFLHHARSLHDEPLAALTTLGNHLTADRAVRESPLAAIWLWIKRRIERVPSQESLGVARFALEQIRDQPIGNDLAQQFRTTGAELMILLSTASYEAAADTADALRNLLPQLSAEQHVESATGIRYLLDLAVDAYIGACRLNDAEIALDMRGSTTSEVDVRDVHRTRAFLRAMRGDVVGAKSLLDEVPVHADATVFPEMPVRERIARAAILFGNGEPDLAMSILREIESMYASIIEWPFAAYVTARILTATKPAAGLEQLRLLMHDYRNVPISRRSRHLLRSAVADLALTAGDVPMAHRMLDEIDAEDHLLRVSAARIALITGDPDATRDLRSLLALPDLWPQTRAQALLTLAVHRHRAGHADEAQRALNRAIAITSAMESRFFQWLAPRKDLHEIAGGTDTELPTDLSVTRHLDAALASIRLTNRESNLLARLESGSTMTEIAAGEFVALSTVKSQAASLYRKLGVGSRQEAVERARRRGILR